MKNEKEKFMTNTAVVCLGALICCLLWGSAFPCIKIGYELSGVSSNDTASQILFAGIRFFFAGILAIIIGSVSAKKFLYPRKDEVPKVLWLSIFQTIIQYLFFYIGLAHTTGVKASIIEGVNVFVAVFVAGVIFKQEKITNKKILGSIIGFLGVVIVNLSGGKLDADLSFFGEGFIFISTIAYALSSVYLKRFSEKHNTVMLSGYQFLVGGFVMVIAGIVAGGSLGYQSRGAIMMIAYLAFVSAIAYSLWGILLKYNSVSRVAVFGFMNPVFGVILSAILLNERDKLGLSSVLALILVAIGIFIVNYKKD